MKTYTIERRSYGLQITVDAALQPEEIDALAQEMKRTLAHGKNPHQALGIFVRPRAGSAETATALKPQMYVIE